MQWALPNGMVCSKTARYSALRMQALAIKGLELIGGCVKGMKGDILKSDNGIVLELQHNFARACRTPADLCVVKTPTAVFVQRQAQLGSHA